MADEYQRGTDTEWLLHSNQELERAVKAARRQNQQLQLLSLVLLLALGWVVYKFQQRLPLEELWQF